MHENVSGSQGQARLREPGRDDRLATSAKGPSKVLLEIGDLIVGGGALPDLFKNLAPHVLQLASCDVVTFSLHDPYQNRMVIHFWRKDHEGGELDSFPVDESVSGWALVQRQAIFIPDIDLEERFPTRLPFLRKHGVKSYTALPMTTVRGSYGALGLGKYRTDVLDKQQMEFLSQIAQMVALAVENQETHHACKEQRKRLESLVAISRELSSSLDLEKLVPVTLSHVRRIANYDHAVLALLEDDGRTLQMYGVDAPAWEPFLAQGRRVPLKDAPSARAIAKREITFLTVDDLSNLGTPLANAMRESGIQSLCNVPLLALDQVWGSLNLGSARKDAFGQVDVEYLQQVANHIAAALENARAYREIAQLKDRLAQEKHYLENEIQGELHSDEIVGNSAALKRVLDYAAIVASTDSTVLITGETGTGKERVARSIHAMSRRRDRSFIKLNCAAIPTGLLESELFGHEKGAFTGAVSQKVGRLELADKGTLFLDEIGEIPLELQPKLLRVLQDQEFERLGGIRTIHVDVRLIAATNRDLVRAVEEKQFRGDLFYRLHVFPLHLPALRDRREDIPLLVRYFVARCAVRLNRRIEFIPDEAIEAMLKWKWPGNIRELENFIERSVILSEGNTLRPPLAELHQEIARLQATPDDTLRGREREHIIEILRQTRGMLSGPAGAAARLGMKRTTLQYRMQKLGISRIDFLN